MCQKRPLSLPVQTGGRFAVSVWKSIPFNLRTNRPVCGKTLACRRIFLYTECVKTAKPIFQFCILFCTQEVKSCVSDGPIALILSAAHGRRRSHRVQLGGIFGVAQQLLQQFFFQLLQPGQQAQSRRRQRQQRPSSSSSPSSQPDSSSSQPDSSSSQVVTDDPSTWPLDDQNNLVAPRSLTTLPNNISSYITDETPAST